MDLVESSSVSRLAVWTRLWEKQRKLVGCLMAIWRIRKCYQTAQWGKNAAVTEIFVLLGLFYLKHPQGGTLPLPLHARTMAFLHWTPKQLSRIISWGDTASSKTLCDSPAISFMKHWNILTTTPVYFSAPAYKSVAIKCFVLATSATEGACFDLFPVFYLPTEQTVSL